MPHFSALPANRLGGSRLGRNVATTIALVAALLFTAPQDSIAVVRAERPIAAALGAPADEVLGQVLVATPIPVNDAALTADATARAGSDGGVSASSVETTPRPTPEPSADAAVPGVVPVGTPDPLPTLAPGRPVVGAVTASFDPSGSTASPAAVEATAALTTSTPTSPAPEPTAEPPVPSAPTVGAVAPATATPMPPTPTGVRVQAAAPVVPTAAPAVAAPTVAPVQAVAPAAAAATGAIPAGGPPGVVSQIPASAWNWMSAHGWRIDWRQGPGPGRVAEAQYHTRTIVIWYDTARSDAVWAGAVGHELGHAVSWVHLSADQKSEWTSMRGLSSWSWVPGSGNDFSVGEGDFAEAFMSYLLGHGVRSLGGPITQEHRAWIAAHTPF